MFARYGGEASRALFRRRDPERPFPWVAVANTVLALGILVVALTVAVRTIISR